VFHASISSLGSGVLVEHAVYGLDRWLRQRQGVYEFSDDPMCLFRIRRSDADCDVALGDGTVVRCGDPVLDLHLWNEHVPPVGVRGFSVAWARQMTRGIELSLYALARYLKATRALDDIVALRGDMRFGTVQRNGQLARIAGRYGFEPAGAAAEASATAGLKRLAENLFIGMLVLATNPVALRSPVLRRGHKLVYLSRAALETRYAPAALLGSKRVGGAGTC
jgi:hypothetical protein